MKNTFSAAGAAQLISDVDHLCNVVDVALGPATPVGGSAKVMQKLTEGLLLLGLSAHAAASQAEDESGSKATDPLGEGGSGHGLGLWAVEKRLFKDNESAREVLAELAVETLAESEARSILERRVEIGN